MKVNDDTLAGIIRESKQLAAQIRECQTKLDEGGDYEAEYELGSGTFFNPSTGETITETDVTSIKEDLCDAVDNLNDCLAILGRIVNKHGIGAWREGQ